MYVSDLKHLPVLGGEKKQHYLYGESSIHDFGLGLVQLLFWLLASACQGPYILLARLSCRAGTLKPWTGFIERYTLVILLNEAKKGDIGALGK